VRAARGRVSDRIIGILLGILLGLAIIIAFLFLGSRSTIDAPSLSGGSTPAQTQTSPAPQATAPKAPKAGP
jgi:multisubunit Na+/H+ antiporter MnhC subunit